MIKGIEGRRTWVSDGMLEKIAEVLGVLAFQLLIPPAESLWKAAGSRGNPLVDASLLNLRQNLQDGINLRLDQLMAPNKESP
jgi:hypothetical protein